MSRRLAYGLSLAAVTLWLAGCATPRPGYDMTAFRQAKPASILVLPPVNESPEVNAPWSFLAQVTSPLAESGYYVVPVAVMMETFRQNGLNLPDEIQNAPATKLRDIFGSDAALYIKITKFGSQYTVFNSVVQVTAEARLVDLRSGQQLWAGAASANNNEGGNQNQGGLIGALVGAVVKQIIHSTTDAAHPIAGVAANRLLTARPNGGILYGPRSPNYGQDDGGAAR
jgi:hypothetical protein